MREANRVSLLVCMLLIVSGFGGAGAATVDLTVATKYQVVDGFGSHDNLNAWKIKVGPFYETVDLAEVGFYDSLANDMQIMRMAIPPFQPSEGAAYNDLDFTHQIQLANRGMTKFWGACWSPPAWMKSNNSLIRGGALLPQYYDDFARLLVEYARQFKEKTGVDLYGLSLQNEPLFSEPYSSCVYNNGTYRDLVKVAGPILDAAWPNLKLLGAEDVLVAASRCNGWINAILADAQAVPHMDIYAVHCHTQIFDDPTDPYRGWWNTVGSVANPAGLPLWMTEVGDNFDTTWATASRLCATIANSFKYGNCRAWVWWVLARDTDENAAILNGEYRGKYYQMAHFGRFVKPGARRIGSSCSDGNLTEVAFENLDGSIVAVVVNTRASANTASLAGAGLPGEFRAHQSSGNDSKMIDMGIVTTGNALALPRYSMTTFTSNTSTGVRHMPRPAAVEVIEARKVCTPALNGAAVALDLVETSRVTLSVYNAQGSLVTTVVGNVAAGESTLSWNRAGDGIAAGVYVGRVRVEPLADGAASNHVVRLSVN